MIPMVWPSIKGMQRETDGEFVVAIMNCLQRPFKNTMPFEPQTPEEIAADSVRLLIELLRVQRIRGFGSHADDLKLIKLLRKRGYEKYADEIEEKVYMDIPPTPAKTNELKFNCA